MGRQGPKFMSLLAALVETRGWSSGPLHGASTARAAWALCIVGRANIEARDQYGDTPLLLAINREDESIVKMLIDLGADVDAPSDQRWTPMMYAVCLDSPAILMALLVAGADVNAQRTRAAHYSRDVLLDREGYTSLLLMLETIDDPQLRVQYAALLLRWGADPTISERNGRTAVEPVRRLLPEADRMKRFSIPEATELLLRLCSPPLSL